MRKLIASVFVSVDGLIVAKNEDLGWVLHYEPVRK